MVVKTSTTAYPDGGYSQAGDTIAYSYAVTNNGPGPVTGVTVSDNKIPSADISCPSPPSAAGRSETCTGTYTVTQADVDAGSVTNTATASATSVQRDGDLDHVLGDRRRLGCHVALSLTKSTTSTGYGAAGHTIPYSYLVTNTGTTTSRTSRSGQPGRHVTCPDSSLAPGASETCTGPTR